MDTRDSPVHDRMVFLIGARRSGTNWLQRVLAAHPGIVAIPSETYVISHGLRPLADRVQHGAVGLGRTGAVFMERGDFLEASREFCDRLFTGMGETGIHSAKRILERTPWHSYCVDLIAAVYPDAWVLHIIRDGRDVARSLLAQPWGPNSMREAAEEWRGSVVSARAGPAPNRYREVRYESLLADPAGTLPEIVSWLNLEPDRATVEQMLTEAGVQFNVDPAERGIRTGKWRSLTPAQLAEFDEVAGELNRELGYDDDGPAARAERPEAPSGRGAAPGSEIARPSIRGVRRRLGLAIDRRAFDREALNRLEAAQVVFERLLEAIHVEPERIEELMLADAVVRIAGRDGADWTGRGTIAAKRLVATLRDDPLRGAQQLRGDVHSGLPTFTAVLSYELSGGSVAERVVAARIRGGRISAIYVFSNAGA